MLEPKQVKHNNKTQEYYSKVIETGLLASDATGKFPVTSKLGHKYISVFYSFDENCILVRPMRNRTDTEYTKIVKEVIEYLQKRGLHPKMYLLDNEISDLLINEIEAINIKTNSAIQYQLTPAQIQRRNLVERAVQTFKNHFIGILTGCHPTFPNNHWNKLLKQAEISLNLLRTSRINNNLSAYEQLEGTFNFNKTPLASLGIKVIAYEMLSHRGTWRKHGINGWYIGPAEKYYQCYTILTKKNKE